MIALETMDTRHTTALPLDEHTKNDEDALKQITLARKKEWESRLERKLATFEQLRGEIERDQLHIEHLTALLVDLGVGTAQSPATALPSTNGTAQAQPDRTAFVAGNKSSATPRRRPEYETVSLTNAASQLLSSGRTMSLDELANAIYEIHDSKQSKAAKGNLRTTLATGVERGRWMRISPGRFRMKPENAM